MLYIYLRCPHFKHQNNPFQSKQSLNTFTKETGSIKVKLPKVGSNAIVPVPVGAGPNDALNDDDGGAVGVQMND
jgi:hypothetical protein